MAPIDIICDDVFINMVTCLNVCFLVLQEEASFMLCQALFS